MHNTMGNIKGYNLILIFLPIDHMKKRIGWLTDTIYAQKVAQNVDFELRIAVNRAGGVGGLNSFQRCPFPCTLRG